MLSAFTWYFLSFKGRIGRQEFALGLFALVLIDMLVVRVGVKLVDSGPRYYDVGAPSGGSVLHAVLSLSMWAFAAIVVKRLHDFNLSGRWALALLLIPHFTVALGIPYWVPFLLAVATLAALPGWRGDNRFGLDPLPQTSG